MRPRSSTFFFLAAAVVSLLAIGLLSVPLIRASQMARATWQPATVVVLESGGLGVASLSPAATTLRIDCRSRRNVNWFSTSDCQRRIAAVGETAWISPELGAYVLGPTEPQRIARTRLSVLSVLAFFAGAKVALLVFLGLRQRLSDPR